MKITRFEDIESWKSARRLTNAAYDSTITVEPGLQRQIRRAAVSVMANIAEGFDAGTDREFIRFLRIAKRSATEVQSHLYVCLDRRFMTRAAFDSLYANAQEVKRLIGGFMKYLQTPRKVGS